MGLKGLLRNELVKGSLVLFILISIFNLFNYVFHFSMARLLGPADYGVLAVLMSIAYVFGIPSETIQTVISRYTSNFNLKKKFGKIKDLFYRGVKRGLQVAFVLFILFLIFAYFISDFLNINYWLVSITGLLIFVSFIVPVARGVLQGRKKFSGLGINMVSESVLKVVIAVSLVLLGWKVYGAIFAVISGILLSFFLSFLFMREVLSSKREESNAKGIYTYSFPVFIAISSIVLMYSLDIILAKRFFPAEVAGQYAFVSMIGKAIFFGSYAIGKAMFPLTSEHYENGKKTFNLFKQARNLILLIAGIALVLYYLFPETIIRILSLGSTEYLAASNILFILGLSLTFLSLTNLKIIYSLSIKRMKFASFLILFVIIQIILLTLFHNSLMSFSLAFLFSNFLIFLYSLIFIRR